MSTTDNQDDTVPCANTGCHFWGRPSTGNFCSKCYKEKSADEQPSSKPKEQQPTPTLTLPPTTKEQVAPPAADTPSPSDEKRDVATVQNDGHDEEEKNAKPTQKNKKRCWECRKKVGYTGIECRCGYVFCGVHRYPDKHKCDFDFKSFDRDNLKKANSKIEAAKLEDKL